MKAVFLPEAEKEFREAARYYEHEASGVGLAFVIEVHKAVDAIVAHPLASPEVRGSIRKKVLKHFPYNVLYSMETDLVVIVAIAHQKRRPTYWRRRVRSRRA